MPVDMFNIRTMLAALEQMHTPRTFLLDTFFKEERVFTTEAVDIDVIKGKQRLAPFVSPLHEGKVVERTGFTANSFKPPYIKQKMAFTAQDLLKRAPGETIYQGDQTPEQRAQKQLGKDLIELDEMITRREEWMAASALNTGKITVVGDGVNAEIDFKMDASHKVTLAGAALWTDAASDPLADLRAWKQTAAKDSGLVPDVAVFGADVYKAFVKHANVKGQLDTRRITLGQIDPKLLPSGASYIGTVEQLDIYTYDEYYLDDNAVLQPMVPVDKIFLGSTKAKTTRLYGAILDLKALAAVKRFPKSWEQEDPSIRWVMLQSAPVVCPTQIDAFMSIKAV